MAAPSSLMASLKIYLDGADLAGIRSFMHTPMVKGFTTNPSLMRKAGVTDYRDYCQGILRELVAAAAKETPGKTAKPISFEVFADDLEGMLAQAKVIAAWETEIPGAQIYVKIPVINTQGELTTPIIEKLTRAGVKLNVTALYSPEHIRAVCTSLSKGAPSLVSVFAGRMADAGHDPLPIMRAASQDCAKAGAQCELLWASTREAYNFMQAAETGCQVITAPGEMIKKVLDFGKKSLSDLTFDTVRTFKTDSDAAGFILRS